MAPKTTHTPEQVAAELEENEKVVTYKGRTNKHPGINKNIELITEGPDLDKIWGHEDDASGDEAN